MFLVRFVLFNWYYLFLFTANNQESNRIHCLNMNGILILTWYESIGLRFNSLSYIGGGGVGVLTQPHGITATPLGIS